MPCNFNLRALAAKVKEGIRAAGGTPMELNTIAISDGITMGTSGMKTSLVSREVIADSIELVARGHLFDAIVALSGCDKTIPGTVMALARLDIPGVMLYGGSIRPGRFQRPATSRSRTSSRRSAPTPPASMTDEELHELEAVASPGAGACGGQFTANTMAMAFEVLGISPDGLRDGARRATAPRPSVAVEAGRLVDGGPQARHPARARSSPARASRTRSPRSPPPAARPTASCTCWPSPARSASSCRSTTSTRISARTPLLCDLKPGGPYVAADLYEAGGVPLVARRLLEAGLLHEDAHDGDRPDGRRARRRGHRGARASASCGRSTTRSSPAAAWRSCAATSRPDGCVVKLSGHERRRHVGPARVFEGEEAAMDAVAPRAHPARRRRRHPQRGPGRRPGDARDARGHRRASTARASASTSRCSPTGASPAPPTASWPATSPPRRRAAARSPRSPTATRSPSTSTPGASTSTLVRRRDRRARRGLPAAARPRRHAACWRKYATLVSQRRRGRATLG